MYQEQLEENVKPTHSKYLTLLGDAPDGWGTPKGDRWDWSETIEELKELNRSLGHYLGNPGGRILGDDATMPGVRERTWRNVYDDDGTVDRALTHEVNRNYAYGGD